MGDDRGAVMVIGLFMAMFLIGAMWTVVGIGDAIVYRDKVQEVADHVAFTSAVVHARGMNFIAVLNLVMLAIVALYLVLDVVHQVLDVVATGIDAACGTIKLSLVACPAVTPSEVASDAADESRDAYFNAVKPILTGLSRAQTATAIVTPYGATAAGIEIAKEYKETAFATSTSAIPGFADSVSGNIYDWTAFENGEAPAGDSQGQTSRIGLPVSNEKMNQLCVYAADPASLWLENWLAKLPLFGVILKIPGLQQAAQSIIASAPTSLSCDELDDDFWGRPGPKAPFQGQSYAQGASDWHQVYGFVFGAQKDVSENKVALGMGPKGGFGHKNTTLQRIYQAQAEFFFDCDQTWSDPSCNRPESSSDQIPHAMYSMRWTARLRRVHLPKTAGVDAQLLSSITSGDVLGPIKAGTDTGAAVQDVKDALGNVGDTFAGEAFGALTKQGHGALDPSLSGIAGKIPNMANPPSSSIIH